jgi:hypothetical protein
VKSKSMLLLAVFLFSIIPLNSVSANGSSEVMLTSPNELDCLSDSILECTLPIDAVLSHEWTFKAYNGDVPEEYTFRMSVVDLSNNTQVHSTTTTLTMAQYGMADVTFTPWNGWNDGSSYNISFSAVRTNDNSDVGNTRYFHATFEDTVDVAILSDSYTPAIKQDLSTLGMTYTQFPIDDWSTYLKSGWMSNYQKIVIPSQNDNSAKPTSEGGDGYFEKLGTSSNMSVLESFMAAGGTVQIHLTSSTEYYGYDGDSQSYLPFNMDITARNTAQTKVTYSDIEFANPYHPIFDNVDFTEFQGFDPYSTVAEAIVNTKKEEIIPGDDEFPDICNGYSEEGGYFQRLIQTQADDRDVILGTCNYGDGGMIVTTIDVESNSERADSPTFPLLGNMLSHHLNPYPSGFDSTSQGTDITLNGNVPSFDQFSGEYAYTYLKSNAEVVFSYVTNTAENLYADWEIDGPTDWQGNSMAGGIDHTNASTPSTIFCKVDLSSETGCEQGATWEIILYLHDEHGNARIIPVTVQTDDAMADEFRPVAEAQVEMRWEYADQIEYVGVKNTGGNDWPQYRIHLDGSGSLLVYFDASNSSDEDAEDDNGITLYEWRVLFDAPYGDTNFDLAGHTFEESGASNGQWAYRFNNVTSDPNGQSESLIRIELKVYDQAGKFSEKYRMFFSVVPEGFGDVEPVVQFDMSMNGTQVNSDTITISGTILDGSEQGDVYVEVALNETAFNQTVISKYMLMIEGKYNRSYALGNSDTFELGLNIEDLFDNTTKNQTIFIVVYEGDDRRWEKVSWIEIIISSCRGVEVPANVLDAEPEAYWIWNIETSLCEWSGVSIDSDGDGIPDSPPDSDGDGTPDYRDAFPEDANESEDSDLDGVGNNADVFPFDANETKDTDNDGVGDNGDAFPNDSNETADSDGDGLGDNADAFPEDANETVDSDNDGVGDNGDAFPNDSNETADSDGDGVGDNGDAFPNDANETVDSDGDGVGDNSDVFPNDESESVDSDGDGVGDNADAFPNDSSETKDSDGDGVGDNYQKQLEEEQRNKYIIIGIVVGIIILIAGVIYKQKRNSPIEQQEKQIDLANIAEPTLAQTEPTVTQQWTDESGYTWRMMSNGETMWWDGTDWKNL